MWISILLLSTVLDRATQSAETFWKQITAIECTEQITQTRLDAREKVTARRSSSFGYLVTLKMNGNALAVDESRIPRKSSGSTQSLLLTNGFPALLLIFHPDFQDLFDFNPNEKENTIAFRARAGGRSMSAIRMSGRVYPIRWAGVAWVDPENGAIRRIEAAAEPMPDIGIEELRAEVEYGSVSLDVRQSPYWLPARATILLRSPRQQWKNVHEFRSYRVFSVTSTTVPAQPKRP
jgi:hypothetical protein